MIRSVSNITWLFLDKQITLSRTNLPHIAQQEQLVVNDSASNSIGKSNFDNNMYAMQKIAWSNPVASIHHDYECPPVTVHFPSERDRLPNIVTALWFVAI